MFKRSLLKIIVTYPGVLMKILIIYQSINPVKLAVGIHPPPTSTIRISIYE